MQCEVYPSNASFQLQNEDGEFLMVPSDADHPYEDDEQGRGTCSELSREETNKVELLCQSVTDLTRERDTLSHELETTRQ